MKPKIILNENKEVVRTVKEGLKAKGGILSLPYGTKRGYKMYLQGVQGANC